MPPAVQLICRRQTGRTAPHYSHPLSCAHPGRLRLCIPLLISILYNSILILLGGHRLPVQPAGTSRLTERRTHPARKLRKIIRLLQPSVSLLPIPHIHQIIPLRNQIMQRTPADHPGNHHPRLTERHPALHTPRPLPLLLLPAQMLMKLPEMPNPLPRLLRPAHFSLKLHKPSRFSHFSTPFN